jgi:pimeloyl-ACP methyl ester carboxylesterase
MNKTILFLHGFASSSQGTKGQYFRKKFSALSQVDFHAFDFTPTPQDFEYMTITGLINRLRQYLLDQRLAATGVNFIASSMGALAGLHYAHRFGGVEKMLFLAPALSYPPRRLLVQVENWEQSGAVPAFHFAFEKEIPLRYDLDVDGRRYAQTVPPAAPLLIIHGQHDDVIPSRRSRDYAASYPGQVRLLEVDADHRLNDQLDFVWEQAWSFFYSSNSEND